MIAVLKAGRRLLKGALGNADAEGQKTLLQRTNRMKGLPQVRIAVIGAGRFAQEHLEILAAMENVVVAGVSNRSGSDLSWMKEKFGAEATFGDYRKMLEAVRPDAVFIVVSPLETFAVAAECLERGIACLLEKPAGFSSEETATLAELAEKHGVFNMVGVNRRYISSIHQALGSLLSRGETVGIHIEAPEAIGRIRQNGTHPERVLENWLLANSIHAIDLFRCLGGEVLGVSGLRRSRTEKSGDSFVAMMELERGGIGSYVSHWNTAGGWSIQLFGEGIKAVLDFNRGGEFRYANGKSRPIPNDPIDRRFKPGLYAQDEAFVRALALGEPLGWPASDLKDQVGTMKLIEAMATA